MKKMLLILFSFFLLTSCASSHYYYSKLDSKNKIKNRYGEFVSGDDSVRVIYSFTGEGGAVHITIFNNTSGPLYVDWQKSALIVNDEAVNYQGEQVSINGNVNSSTSHYDAWSNSYGSFNGMLTLPKGISFVPPHARISNSSLYLNNLYYDSIPDSRYEQITQHTVYDGERKLKKLTFSESTSPLHIRSYLTIYKMEEEKYKPMVFQQSFFLSNLTKAKNVRPANFVEYDQGDFFYTKTVKGGGAGTIFGIAAIVVGAAALEGALGGYSE